MDSRASNRQVASQSMNEQHLDRSSPPDDRRRRAPTRLGAGVLHTIVAGAVPFLAVLCLFAFYGQEHRRQSGDTYGTMMTAVALVQQRTIWLDDYLPYIQARSGERPYMVTEGRGGHPVNVTPFAPAVLALPAVLVFDLAGTAASGWESWMEAGMLY